MNAKKRESFLGWIRVHSRKFAAENFYLRLSAQISGQPVLASR
jgi:hypothetical protein